MSQSINGEANPGNPGNPGVVPASDAHSVPQLPAHAHGRKATWFELFFDLVFVVAVAQIASVFSHHYDWHGALLFAFTFMAVWWCWLGHTFYSTRFDEDTPAQRGWGLLHILTVAWLAFGATDITGARAWVFASGMAAFKTLLALSYLRALRWPGARGLVRAYAALYFLQALMWGVSVVMPPDVRWTLWGGALLLDLASPWWVARYTHQIPPHPEHLPERFGLFTIILLGEGMASVVHAWDHGATLTLDAGLAGLGGALLTFLLWIGYFERVGAHRERHVEDTRGGSDMRLWAYSHVALYLGVAALAAGTVFLASQTTLTATVQHIFASGITLGMVGISLLGVASSARRSGNGWKRGWIHLGVAAIYWVALMGIALDSAAHLLAASAGVLVLQLWLATALKQVRTV